MHKNDNIFILTIFLHLDSFIVNSISYILSEWASNKQT